MLAGGTYENITATGVSNGGNINYAFSYNQTDMRKYCPEDTCTFAFWIQDEQSVDYYVDFTT